MSSVSGSRAAEPLPYALLADAVLALHVALVLFVVGGFVLVVVAEAWFGVVCPLTSLEMWLREQADGSTYAGGFIEHWLSRVLYYDAPPWVFTAVYSLFGVAVAATWWRFPPRRRWRALKRAGDAPS